MTAPIAYTYDADVHCPTCTQERFGICPDGFIACTDDSPGHPAPALDSESNPVGVIAPWDEWWDPDCMNGPQSLTCADCSVLLDEIEGDTDDDDDDDCECDACMNVDEPAQRDPDTLPLPFAQGERDCGPCYQAGERSDHDPSLPGPHGLDARAARLAL